MPTLITHGIIGLVAAKVSKKKSKRFWALAFFCSVIPDADVIGLAFGIEYGDFFGHRGFSHSIMFSFFLSVFVTSVFLNKVKFFSKSWWKHVSFYSVLGISHGVLDSFTNGGLGIALLSPFDNTRYFSPWTPIMVSPIGIRAFFSEWGLKVLICEIIYILIPMMLIAIGYAKTRNKCQKDEEASTLLQTDEIKPEE